MFTLCSPDRGIKSKRIYRLDAVAALRERLGAEHGMLFDEIKDCLCCGKCRGKEFGMIRQPNTGSRKVT